MPYTDPQRKQEWEQQHRTERLARRRELRRIQQARQEPAGIVGRPEGGNAALIWAPLVIGGALASYDPKLAMGAGGLTLVAATIGKKGAGWWIAGALILLIGCLLYWCDRSEESEPTFAVDTLP